MLPVEPDLHSVCKLLLITLKMSNMPVLRDHGILEAGWIITAGQMFRCRDNASVNLQTYSRNASTDLLEATSINYR